MRGRNEFLGRARRVLGSLLLSSCCVAAAVAQDIEPRRWTHMPIGTDLLGVGYVFTTGDLKFDPALRIQDADVDMHTVLVSYNHYLNLFGNTARIDVQVPWQDGHWEGLLDGAPASTSRVGLGDPRVRLSVHLAGAPALEGKEYLDYVRGHETNTIVGAALAVRLPFGEYLEDRLINLGQNRYSFETQFGAVHMSGDWSYELTGSAFFYTDNDEFFGGNTLRQDPLFAAQAHVVHSWESGFWMSAGIAYGMSGESILNGSGLEDDRENLLYGLSVGMPIGGGQAVRVGYIRGESYADVGMDSDSLLLTWSMRL